MSNNNNNSEILKSLTAEISARKGYFRPMLKAFAARQEQIKLIIKPFAARQEQLKAQINSMQEAAVFCLQQTAGPQQIRQQIGYFANITKAQFSAFDNEAIQRAAAEIAAYYDTHRAEYAEFEQEAAARLAAEQEANKAKETAAALKNELIKARAEIDLFRAAINLQKLLDAETPAPQPQQPGHKKQCKKDFAPDITPAEISAIFNGLPQDFNPTKAQFSALFNRPIEMPTPIETTPSLAAALLATLYAAGFIQTAKYAAIASARKCFIYKGRNMTAKQLRDAKEANKSSYKAADFDYIKTLRQ